MSSVGRCQIGCVMLTYVEVDSADHFILGAQFSSDLLGFQIFRFVLFSVVFFVRNFCFNISLFFFTLDAGLLARSQYSEGPATGHLDTGFSWFPYA